MASFETSPAVQQSKRTSDPSPVQGNPRKQTARLVSLDFLRGVAILLVLGAHDFFDHPESGPIYWVEWLSRHYGFSGVDLFFALSGFLVGGLLFKEVLKTGTVDAWRFLVRRALKIWPQYYVFLFIMLGFFLVQHRVAEAKQSLWTFVHLQNFFGTPFEHVWSLGVEEHFYTLVAIIFAVAVYRKAAMDFNSITKIVAGIGVLALASRILAVVHWDDAYWWFKMGTHQRMDALAFGVWISAAYHLKQELFERISSYRVLLWILVVVGLLPLLFFQHQSGFVYTVGFDFLSVSYCSLLILFISAPRFDGGLHAFLQGRFAGWIARIGFYSYGIYLWHWSASQKPTYFLIEKLGYYRHFGPSIGWVLATVTYCGLAIVAGVVTTKVIEIPTLKLRDRLFPTKATNPALM